MNKSSTGARIDVASMIIRRLYPRVLFLTMLVSISSYATPGAPAYDELVQRGKDELQAGNLDQAVTSGKAAIKVSTERWEGYALVGGALMNLKHYEEAADTLSEAIKRAPESKQSALRDLRRQCLLAESGPPAAGSAPAPASTTSQAEIVLWKSIENSRNPADFQTYLAQYPQGAFVALARRHLDETKASEPPKATVSKDILPLMLAAQNCFNQKEWDNGISKLKEAQASPGERTAYDKYIIATLGASAYLHTQQLTAAAAAMEEGEQSIYATPSQREQWPKVIAAIRSGASVHVN